MWRPVRFAVSGMVLAAGTASAQHPPPSDTLVLPTVEVQAARSSRALDHQPLASTHVGRDAFRGASGYRLDEALRFVPGVLAQSRYGTSDIRLTIRGYGARGAGERSNAGTSRGIRVLIDGFPETEPDGRTSFDGVDLASALGIDVIRSNASSVFGNAAGGVVSIATDGPLDESYATVETGAGSYGLRRAVGRVGQRLGAGGGRVFGSLTRTDYDGWREHTSSERTFGTASVVGPVGSHTSLGVYAMATSHLFHIPGPLTRAEVAADPRQANATFLARDERRFNRLGRLGVRVEHQLAPPLSLSAMTFVNPKVLERSERGTFRNFNRYHIGGNAMITWRHPVAGGEGSLVAGADEAYQDGSILFYSLSPTGGRGSELRTNKREGANNVGVFAQEELSVGRWGFTAGLRFDDISYDVEDFLEGGLSGSKSFRGVTPKLGVTFEPTAGRLFYASLGGGVEAPAGNETDPASTFGQDSVFAINPLLDPIRSTTVEGGMRGTVLLPSGSWTYDLAVYQTWVRNEIIPFRGGRFFFTAGRVRRFGTELGTQVTLGRFTGRLALAYSRHRYTEYLVDSVHFGVPGAFADFSGHRVVGVPDVTYTLGGGYLVPFLGGIHAEAVLQGTSAYFADDANQVSVPSYRTVDLTISLPGTIRLGGGVGLQGAVRVNNLFDRRYIASAFLNPDVVNGEPVAFEPGITRNVFVTFTLGRIGAAP